jgi:hypothetical protein
MPAKRDSSPWVYHGRSVREYDLEGCNSFVYIITHLRSGKKYIGKKRLKRKITRKPLKGKKRRRIARLPSDWRDYWGSNEALLRIVKRAGPKAFERRIIRFCSSLSEASYYEAKEQFALDVLLHSDMFWNEWIMVKIRASHLRSLRNE